MQKMMCSISAAFGCDFGLFARIFGHQIAPVSMENRAIRRDFGAEHACTDRKVCAIIAGSLYASSGVKLKSNFECAVRCARKICKIVGENHTSSRWFLKLSSAQHVLCERTAQREVLDVC